MRVVRAGQCYANLSLHWQSDRAGREAHSSYWHGYHAVTKQDPKLELRRQVCAVRLDRLLGRQSGYSESDQPGPSLIKRLAMANPGSTP